MIKVSEKYQLAIFSILLLFLSSCQKKDTNNTKFHFVNHALTPVTVTLNRLTFSIATGDSLNLPGAAGTSANIVATTKGSAGATITWNIPGTFPTSGSPTIITFDVPASYFLLKIFNSAFYFLITDEDMNYGNSDEQWCSVAIPYNESKNVGYFKVHTPEQFILIGNNSLYRLIDVTLPNTANQAFLCHMN